MLLWGDKPTEVPRADGTARRHSQNKNVSLTLIITEAIKAHFFVCKQTDFVNQMFGNFVKMTLTRVNWSKM